jgi:hypothetical protein
MMMGIKSRIITMGAKSTLSLTRHDAEESFVALMNKIATPMHRLQAAAFTDEELEDMLERLNDTVLRGEGDAKYRITKE